LVPNVVSTATPVPLAKKNAVIANIEAGLVISLSNLHFSQVGYEFFRSS